MIKSLPGADMKTDAIVRLDRRAWTYDDLREMPETMDRYEIIDGTLYMSPSANVWRHQRAAGNLYMMLRHWLDAHDWGEVYFAPADVVMTPDKAVQPDLFVVAKERLDIVDAYVDGVPDLIVEVVSPSSITYDRKTKYNLYEKVGVREYWIVDPEAHTVDVFVRREGRFDLLDTFAAGDTAASVLLDGFSAAVDDIIPE
ncbi:MAG: Uma2 family endonuclease [Bacteroidetes bacterium]|jgi:Uma2 family endonuclease|nr:Uma2 family endonuclease [Bacteroidota bacterium]